MFMLVACLCCLFPQFITFIVVFSLIFIMVFVVLHFFKYLGAKLYIFGAFELVIGIIWDFVIDDRIGWNFLVK